MIYNRTISDVNEAKKIVETKVNAFEEITKAEAEVLERGIVTYNTLNRIESEQARIKSKLNSMGYYDTPIENKEWALGDVFKLDDLERIVRNNAILRTAFFVLKNTPQNAVAKYSYVEFNAIEKILYDISSVIINVTWAYRECGQIYCGG